MDRLDAMRVFVTAIDEGSLAAAARKLEKSPAAMSRAIAMLETEIGSPLFERNNRIVRLTEAGELYAAAARRILGDFDQIGQIAAGARSAPRGMLTVTAPLVAGVKILRPVLDAYLDDHSEVHARLSLTDRSVNLIDDGIDVALRIANLSDSGLMAIRVGSVRRVVCAAPAYLANRPPVRAPRDLSSHQTIALADTRQAETWSFPSDAASGGRNVRLTPRLAVNSIEAAKGSAIDGKGITRLLSYQIAEEVRDGRLVILLESFEPEPLPVHLVTAKERLAAPRVRSFVDFALPKLRAAFATRSID